MTRPVDVSEERLVDYVLGELRRDEAEELERMMRDRGVVVVPEWLPHTADKKANEREQKWKELVAQHQKLRG